MFGKNSTAVLASTTARLVASEADVAAMTEVVRALASVRSPQEAVRIALDTVRERFGWAYGSFWALDPSGGGGRGVLRFAQESGDAGAEFRQVTLEAPSPRGSGCRDGPGGPATSCSCPTWPRSPTASVLLPRSGPG